MSIIKMDMFCLKCDSCGTYHANDDDGSSFFYSPDEVRCDGENNGDWYTHGEKHYCKECYRIDEEDILHVKETGERFDMSLAEGWDIPLPPIEETETY